MHFVVAHQARRGMKSVSSLAAQGIAIGHSYRIATLAVIATVVGILDGAPVNAFDTRADKTVTADMTANSDDWTKELEADLAPLASNMWGAQKQLEEKGYRVDRGNKSPTGWWFTAGSRNAGHSIKVQSDGTKLVVTAER
jgi:hypothetical protein